MSGLKSRPAAIAAGLSVLAMTAVTTGGCNSVDDDRIPSMPVFIPFVTQAEWVTYGVAGAATTRSFIKQQRIPAGYSYSMTSATGFGGVLLVCDYNGDYRAFDLACPVEVRSDVRIRVIADDTEGVPRGECPVCHSTYDIFRYGGPLGGPAAREGYGLTHYFVGPGVNGEYMLVSR